jgi:molybdopterin molybdotransferase
VGQLLISANRNLKRYAALAAPATDAYSGRWRACVGLSLFVPWTRRICPPFCRGQCSMSQPELSVDGALAELRRSFVRITGHETVAVREALGRILATDVVSRVDSPAFDNSAMDGFAVRAEDCIQPTQLAVIGTALAGHSFDRALAQGQAVRIMTGAPLPLGADAVVMSEDTVETESGVRLTRGVASGTNVRRKGEHVQRGECVLRRGRRLRAQDLGLAASVGAASLDLMRRLKVGVLSTGDELVDAPADLPASGAYDGNRPLLCALASAAGHDVLDLGISADDSAAFARALARATTSGIDVLITTGGAAQGDADVVRHHGDVRFMAIDFRPGRGVAVGPLQRRARSDCSTPGQRRGRIRRLPAGRPPLLAWIAGAEAERPLALSLPLVSDARANPAAPRATCAPGSTAEHRGGRTAKDQGSAMLRTVPRGCTGRHRIDVRACRRSVTTILLTAFDRPLSGLEPLHQSQHSRHDRHTGVSKPHPFGATVGRPASAC